MQVPVVSGERAPGNPLPSVDLVSTGQEGQVRLEKMPPGALMVTTGSLGEPGMFGVAVLQPDRRLCQHPSTRNALKGAGIP